MPSYCRTFNGTTPIVKALGFDVCGITTTCCCPKTLGLLYAVNSQKDNTSNLTLVLNGHTLGTVRGTVGNCEGLWMSTVDLGVDFCDIVDTNGQHLFCCAEIPVEQYECGFLGFDCSTRIAGPVIMPSALQNGLNVVDIQSDDLYPPGTHNDGLLFYFRRIFDDPDHLIGGVTWYHDRYLVAGYEELATYSGAGVSPIPGWDSEITFTI